MTKPMDTGLAKREADRRNRENDQDMGKYEMRPRDPYDTLRRAGLPVTKPEQQR